MDCQAYHTFRVLCDKHTELMSLAKYGLWAVQQADVQLGELHSTDTGVVGH